jgi:hypothetical protein
MWMDWMKYEDLKGQQNFIDPCDVPHLDLTEDEVVEEKEVDGDTARELGVAGNGSSSGRNIPNTVCLEEGFNPARICRPALSSSLMSDVYFELP